LIAHFYSPLSSAIVYPATGDDGIDLFQSDFTRDGTAGDPLPRTKFGQFGRQADVKGLTNIINNFNNNVVGTPTPAGQALVSAGLMTVDQLNALGATPQAIALPTSGFAVRPSSMQ